MKKMITRKTTKKGLSIILTMFMFFGMANMSLYAFATNVAEINATNFPDANWRTFVSTNYDTNSDGYLSETEAAAPTSINVASSGIADLKGIEYFVNLATLRCYDNDLTALDVTSNTKLSDLRFQDNQITSIDLSHNPDLYRLYAYNNALTHLDVSYNPNLTIFYCANNGISELNVSSNPLLETLSCTDNQLKILDVGQNLALKNLHCFNNQIAELDVTNNTLLEYLRCYNNCLSTLDITGKGALATINTGAQTPTLNLKYDSANSSYYVPLSGPNYAASRITNLSAGTADSRGITFGSFNDVPATVTYNYDTVWSGGTNTISVTATVNKGAQINTTNFPDSTWRTFVGTKDTDSNGYLSVQEADAVASIDVSSSSIADLKGIEYFTKATYLDCSYNQLTALNLSNNTALLTLSCSDNNLTQLNVSNNALLQNLNCSTNEIASLNFTKNTTLEYLDCSENQLTYLNISQNKELIGLVCHVNQLTSLDLTHNEKISVLTTAGNPLETLDVRNLEALTILYCMGNGLTSLDLSQNVALTNLQCYQNEFSTFDVSDKANLTDFDAGAQAATLNLKYMNGQYYVELSGKNYSASRVTNLSFGTADSSGITLGSNFANIPATITYSYNTAWSGGTETIDVTATINKGAAINDTNFPDSTWRNYVATKDTDSNGYLSVQEADAVTWIDVSDCSIANLTGIEYFAKLERLWCNNNQLTALDVHKNTELLQLDCEYNQLTALDLSKNIKLDELYCYNNQLTALDVSYNTALTRLVCHYNSISSLVISNNTALEVLYCGDNQLTKLDVSNNALLESLDFSTNQISSIDVTNNTALTYLNCSENQLTTLNVTQNPELTMLLCHANQITSLNFSQNDKIEVLTTAGNPIKTLNVSNMINLTELYCQGNGLKSLDLSQNDELTTLQCYQNEFSTFDVSSNANLTEIDAGSQKVLATLQYANGEYFVALSGTNYDPSRITNLLKGTADARGITFSSIDEIPATLTYSYDTAWTGGTETIDVEMTFDKGVAINAINFPDANFRTYVATKDLDSDDFLSTTEAEAVTSISVYNSSIANLTGIEYFTKATYLDCSDNQLTSLNLSNNSALVGLVCDHNQLASLDLSNNKKLDGVICTNNLLTSLNISGCSVLTGIDCSNNQLETLDVSNNKNLEILGCHNNQLTVLDLSQNTALKEFACFGNHLTELDVSNCATFTAYIADTQNVQKSITYMNGKYYVELPGNYYTGARVTYTSEGTADDIGIYFDTLQEVPDSLIYIFDAGQSKTMSVVVTIS